MFNIELHAVEAEDNGQTSATFFGGNLPYDALNFRIEQCQTTTCSPSTNDRRHRFVGSFHYQPTYLWGIGFGGILTLESGLPLTPRITGNLAAAIGRDLHERHERHGRLDRRTVASGFNTDRQTGPQDVRHARLEGLLGWRHRQHSGPLGGLQPLQHRELLRQFSDAAYDVHRNACVRRGDQHLLTVNLRPDPGYLVPRSASLELLGHARHAARFEVPLVGCQVQVLVPGAFRPGTGTMAPGACTRHQAPRHPAPDLLVTPELEIYLEEIRYIRQDVAALVANLADDQFTWRPGRDRWSIGECFEHLNLTAAGVPAGD